MVMKNLIIYGVIISLFCQKTAGQTFLEKEKWPTAFSNKEIVLYDSWIKQRETLNTNFLHELDPDRLLHNFRVNAGINLMHNRSMGGNRLK